MKRITIAKIWDNTSKQPANYAVVDSDGIKYTAFSNSDAFPKCGTAGEGDVLEVEYVEKVSGDKTYYNLTAIRVVSRAGEGADRASDPHSQPTQEEWKGIRDEKQISIEKQNALTNLTTLAVHGKLTPETEKALIATLENRAGILDELPFD